MTRKHQYPSASLPMTHMITKRVKIKRWVIYMVYHSHNTCTHAKKDEQRHNGIHQFNRFCYFSCAPLFLPFTVSCSLITFKPESILSASTFRLIHSNKQYVTFACGKNNECHCNCKRCRFIENRWQRH